MNSELKGHKKRTGRIAFRVSPHNLRLAQFIPLFEQCMAYQIVPLSKSKETISRYRNAFKRFLFWLQDIAKLNIAPNNVDLGVIENYSLWVRVTLGVKNSTRSKYLAVLVVFFRWLREENHIRANPLVKLRLPSSPITQPRPLSPQDVAELLALPDTGTFLGRRDKAMFELAYGSGLRIFETIWLTFSALSLNGLQVGPQLRVKGKGGKTRVVSISDEAARALEDYLALRGYGKPEEAIFTDSFGWGPIDYSTFRSLVLKYRKRLNKNWITGRRLRHSFATHMHENGADIHAIQENMGHENLSTTQIYTRFSQKRVVASHRRANHRTRIEGVSPRG